MQDKHQNIYLWIWSSTTFFIASFCIRIVIGGWLFVPGLVEKRGNRTKGFPFNINWRICFSAISALLSAVDLPNEWCMMVLSLWIFTGLNEKFCMRNLTLMWFKTIFKDYQIWSAPLETVLYKHKIQYKNRSHLNERWNWRVLIESLWLSVNGGFLSNMYPLQTGLLNLEMKMHSNNTVANMTI